MKHEMVIVILISTSIITPIFWFQRRNGNNIAIFSTPSKEIRPILIGYPPVFKLGEFLGSGYVSEVYTGENIQSGERVIIKMTAINESESIFSGPKQNLNGIPESVKKLARLNREFDMYKRLNTSRLLKAYWYGRHGNFQALVVQRVGPSLQEHQINRRNWTREDVFQIGANVILDLEQIHEQSFTHDDIHMVNEYTCQSRYCSINIQN